MIAEPLILRAESVRSNNGCHWLLVSQCRVARVMQLQHWLTSSQWHTPTRCVSKDK
jgi:hypothetical protein